MNFLKTIEYNLLHSKRTKFIKSFPTSRKINEL